MRTITAHSACSMRTRNTEQRETSRLRAALLRDEAVPAGREHGPEGFFENLDPCSLIGEIQEIKRGPRASDAEAPSPPQPPGEPDADTALALFLSGLRGRDGSSPQSFPRRRGTSGVDFGGDGDDRHRDGSLAHPDAGLSHRDGRGPGQTASSSIWIGAFPIWTGGFPVKIGRVPSGWV